MVRCYRKWLTGVASGAFLIGVPAAAQDVAAVDAPVSASDMDDIVVTARRRDESLISTPVTVSVISGAQLSRNGVARLDTLATMVPQLFIAPSNGSVQGGNIVLRGLGVSEGNPFTDQAVSFNVDGAQVARSSVRRLAEVDLAQVEILKGPQALFFGKNSPGGVVVMHTADPTASFKAGVNLGYEFRGRELRGDGYVSGPFTETFGARLAFYGADTGGWQRNIATRTPNDGPYATRLPQSREYGGRLTLKFTPSADFDARLKIAYGHEDGSGFANLAELINCPTGVSQLGGPDDCKLNNDSVHGDPGRAIAALYPRWFKGNAKGETVSKSHQWLGVYEMKYRVGERFDLSSVTSYYNYSLFTVDNNNVADSTGLATMLIPFFRFKIREISEELRISSNLDGPFNFLIGTFLQSSKLYNNNMTLRGAAVLEAENTLRQKGKSASAFAQVTYKLTPSLELAGGARYSWERKSFSAARAATGPVVNIMPRRSWNDLSPEATLTWRPNTNLTVFGGYKHGFLSGGFDGGVGIPLTVNRTYNQQVIEGFEGGVKARLLDNRLRTNLSLYRYSITGLQLSAVTFSATGAPIQRTQNAARARVQGIEFDANLDVTQQLTLHGALSYNRARYLQYIGACYSGQTIAMGCNLLPNAAGVFSGQNLGGRPLVRSPEWSAIGGVRWTIPTGDNGVIIATTNVNYSSSYYGQTQEAPATLQRRYATVDAALSYEDKKAGFTAALVGRNLTDKLYFTRAADRTFSGGGTGTAAGRLADTSAVPVRGRELLIRLSKTF